MALATSACRDNRARSLRIQLSSSATNRRDAGCAHRKTLLRRQSVDLALDREDRIDPAHGREGERRRPFAARGRLGDIGQDKELPPSMAPAGGLGDWGGTSLRIV